MSLYAWKYMVDTILQCRYLIPALNAWAARAQYLTAHPAASQFPGHGRLDDLTTERSKGMWVIDVLGLFFDMLSMGAGTRH